MKFFEDIDKEYRAWMILVPLIGLSAALVICAISLPVAYYYTETTKAAMERGYEQQRERGETIWVKTRERQ